MIGVNQGGASHQRQRDRYVAGPMEVTGAIVCALLLIAGCGTEQLGKMSGSGETEWMKIGITTRGKVIMRYGDPDATSQLPQGEVAVYRPSRPAAPSATPSIPVVTPAPFGGTATEMRPIEPGLGTTRVDASGGAARPSRTIWIRYDAHGVVQEWSFERLSVMPESIP